MDFIKDNFSVFVGLAGAILGHIVASIIAFVTLRERVGHNEADCKACKENMMGQIKQIRDENREDFADMKAITGKLSCAVESLAVVVTRLETIAEIAARKE